MVHEPASARECESECVDIFAEIADERRGLADQLSGLTDEQRATQSLCSEWSVQDVAAHLIVPLEVSIPKFMLAMLVCRGNFDRANVRLARQQSQRPFEEIVETLRRKADTRFTPPGGGPEAPLTDVLVHGLDIRWPLQLTRQVPAERLRTSLTYLTTPAARDLVPKGLLDGLRLEAIDVDWAHGSSPVVSDNAEALLLAMTGRTIALSHLDGDGVAALRSRLSDVRSEPAHRAAACGRHAHVLLDAPTISRGASAPEVAPAPSVGSSSPKARRSSTYLLSRPRRDRWDPSVADVMLPHCLSELISGRHEVRQLLWLLEGMNQREK